MATGASTLSANYDIIDSAVGARTYTSGTRPAGVDVWQGRVIFESDTGNVMMYSGAAWLYLGNRDNAREVAGTSPGADVSSTTAESLIASVTFSATLNRRYRIEAVTMGEHAPTATNGGYFIKFRWAAGSSVTSAGTLLRSTYVKCNSSGVTGRGIGDMVELDYTAATATITVGLFAVTQDGAALQFDIGTNGIDCQGLLVVRDWGIH